MSIPLLGYGYFIASLIPLSVGVIRYRFLDRPMKILTLLCVLAVLSASAELTLGRLAVNNRFIANNYVPVEVLLITLVYFFSTSTAKYRRILIATYALFAIVWTVDKVLFDVPNETNSTMALVSRLFLFSISLLMISTASRDTKTALGDKPIFWVAAGVLLYSTGTFVVVGLGNRLLQLNVTLFVIAWHINWLLLIVANLLYTKGLLCKTQA
jgi:hypothetical protein